MVIKNGADTPLNQSHGNLPNMSGTLSDWSIPLSFGVITKQNVNFQMQETIVYTNFYGVFQPMSMTQIDRKPAGLRSFDWFIVHTTTDLELKHDDIITYNGNTYRVQGISKYDDYGYYEYHINQDYI